MQEASPSLLVSKLGIDPLPATFACLISALLLALLYPALYFIDRRTLARSGCLRVFHARTSGPDTLLYCVQPVRDAPVRGHCLPGGFPPPGSCSAGGPRLTQADDTAIQTACGPSPAQAALVAVK